MALSSGSARFNGIDGAWPLAYPDRMKESMHINEPLRGPGSFGLIDAVADWLINEALRESDIEDLFQGCCDRLLSAGVPLWRGHITFRMIHPLYFSMGLIWRRGEALAVETYPFPENGKIDPQFLASPLYHMIRTQIPFLRRRLVGDEAVLDFPVLPELRDSGGTDYLGFVVSFGAGMFDGMAGSWASDRPSGFSDSDLQALRRIQRRLGLACKIRVKEQIARNVVTAYLGTLAGQRVLDGQIRRGDGETIRAVIWYSDMRGSTTLAERLTRDDFIQILNDYFECTAGAVQSQGGEILAFIGDAVLAIFPLDGEGNGAQQACAKAMMACREAQERLRTINARRSETGAEALSYGLALHLGDVLFGNIGVPERVTFSVIGPTVNEVARLEALTKELERPVLASANFVQHTDSPWTSLGEHALRGVGKPIEVFVPAAD